MLNKHTHYFTYILLSATLAYSSEQSLAVDALIKQELQEMPRHVEQLIPKIPKITLTDTTIYEKVKAVDILLPCISTTPLIIQELSKQSMAFNQMIHDYQEQFVEDECTWLKECETISACLKTHIQSQAIQSTCSPITIPYKNSIQKTSVKFMSPFIVAMLHFQQENGWAKSIGEQRPYTAKQLQFFNIEQNKLYENQRIYYFFKDLYDKNPYPNQPCYTIKNKKDASDYWSCLSEWCKESQLTNKMGLLNDNLVVTYPWGGIKINGKKKEDVHYFAINNSISSLYCLEHNCIIILGSYDGTLTIIDTTQKNTDPNYTTKNFINEDYEAKTVIHPRTVAKGHIDTQLPIIGIAYNDNALYCATKNTIYTCPTPLFTTNTETALNITQVCSVDDDNNITAISLCNTNLTYATDKGMVTILYENNTSITQQVCSENSAVNCLHVYTDSKDQTILLTGTDSGCLDMWVVPPSYKQHRANVLSNTMHIKHDHHIHSIEVSSDKKRILVKTTEYKAETEDAHAKYIDHVYLYSTPEQLSQDYQQYSARVTKIENLCTIHKENAQLLYKIYTQNIDFLNSKNTRKSADLKENIIKIIKTLLSNTQVQTLADLKNFLLLFYGVRIEEPISINASRMSSKEITHPLDNIISTIKQHQLITCATVIKNLYQTKRHSQSDLDTFAQYFNVEIDWNKLLNKETIDLDNCLTPNEFTIHF